MSFKQRKLILVLGLIFSLITSSISVYAVGTGGTGGDTPNTGGGHGSPWSKEHSGVEFVYFDRGGNPEAATPVIPIQGYWDQNANNGKGGWKAGSNSAGDKSKDFFIKELTKKINWRHGTHYSYCKIWQEDELVKAMEEAAKEAVKRGRLIDPDLHTARIVGVAVTYRGGNHSSFGKNVWTLNSNWASKKFDQMWRTKPALKAKDNNLDRQYMDTSSRAEDGVNMWKEVPGEKWQAVAKKINYHKGDTWAEWLWKDMQSDFKEKFGSLNNASTDKSYRYLALAVPSNIPDVTPTPVNFKKTFALDWANGNASYSLAQATFTVYDSNNKVIGSVTTNDKGVTPNIDLYSGTYTVIETVTPKGCAGYQVKHTLKIGEDYDEGTETAAEPYVPGDEGADPIWYTDDQVISLNTATNTFSIDLSKDEDGKYNGGKFWVFALDKKVNETDYDNTQPFIFEEVTGNSITLNNMPENTYFGIIYTEDGNPPDLTSDDVPVILGAIYKTS